MNNPFDLIDARLSNIETLLLDIKHGPIKQNTQPEADQLLTIQQASEHVRLTVPTLYGYVHRSEIPVCKRGNRLYFSKQELTAWIKKGRKKTLSELSSEADHYLAQN